jgi:hypothetical protein
LSELIQRASNGEIDQNTFERRAREITTALLLLAFLAGSRMSLTQLNTRPEAQMSVAEIERQATNAVRRLSYDIYVEGAFAESDDQVSTPQERINHRVGLWGSTVLGIFALGQTHRPDDPLLRWVRNPEKDSCTDCLANDGQVHRASEWRLMGMQPQGRNLECGGYNCGCGFEVVAESVGEGNGDA